eukprot:CAMPEP_0185014454 /NCGR_PEP_ID=MMETSP1098-20130426/99326_1 /TAXON_ID=89044 /ORGANISM="Spumella elongata, Strain CCAP 955/1" /LENGTH=363 /DNA_ID=CAMNT_0027543543 /DNA_START=67 /DNA_END=1158 /DNA_ORIENTATION=-
MSAAEERVARVRASLANTLLPLPGSNNATTASTSSSTKKDESATESGDFLAFGDTKNTLTNSTSSAKLPTGGIASMIAAYGKVKSATEEVEELGARDYLLKHNPSSLLNGGSERRVTELNKTFLKNTIRSVESHNRREQVDSAWRQHKLLKRLDHDQLVNDEENTSDIDDGEEINKSEDGDGDEILSFSIDHGPRKPTISHPTTTDGNITTNSTNSCYHDESSLRKRSRAGASEDSDDSDADSYNSDSTASSDSRSSRSSGRSARRSAATSSDVMPSSTAAVDDYTTQRALWAQRKAQALLGPTVVLSKDDTPEDGEVKEKKKSKPPKEKKSKKDKKEKKDKKDKKEKKEKESKHSKHKKRRH